MIVYLDGKPLILVEVKINTSKGIVQSTTPKFRPRKSDAPVPVEVRLGSEVGYWQKVLIGFMVGQSECPERIRHDLIKSLAPLFSNPSPSNEFCAAYEFLAKPFFNWWDKRFLIDFRYAAYRERQDGSAVGTTLPDIRELGNRLVSIALAADKVLPTEWSAPTIA